MNNKAKIVFLILITICLFVSKLQAFTDLPPDHWAYDAVEKLTREGYMDGYLDGSFKGRKVITRYELSLILARILEKMESIKVTGGDVSEDAQAIAKKLAHEFKDELNSLGIRVEEIETKLKKISDKQNEPQKIKISGYYTAAQRYVQDFHTTYDDPWNYGTQDGLDSHDRNGLSPLSNKINLRILGQPYENVETYLELESLIVGSQVDKYYYNDNLHNIEDFNYPSLFEKKSDKTIYPKKMHFKINSPITDVRIFAGEGIVPMTNPFKLTTDKTWLYAPDQGIELTRSKGNMSFFAALYQQDKDYDISTPDNNSIGRQLDDYRGKQYDTYIFHPTFVIPRRYLANGNLILGGTYLEYTKNYTDWGDYNRIMGLEANYTNKGLGSLNVSTEVIRTEDGIDGDGIIKDIGHKLDANYHLGQFNYTMNYYRYGRRLRFRTNDIEALFSDFDKYKNGYKYWNYGRKTGSTDGLLEEGETYFKLTALYDYENKPGERDFKLEGTIMQKWWEQDPENLKESDYYKGEKYSLESWMDVTLKTNARWYVSLIKDAQPNEVGTAFLELELDSRFMHDKVDAKGRIWMERDADDMNLVDDSSMEYGIFSEVSADLSDRLSLKGNMEYKITRGGWDSGNVDPANISDDDDKRDYTEGHQVEAMVEGNYDISEKSSFIGTVKGRWETWSSYPDLDRNTYWLIGTFKNDLTDKLKTKSVWWWKQIRNQGDPVDLPSFTNNYSEMIYNATDKTKIKMIWGDWISANKDDRELWGVDSVETEKKLYIEATTEF